MTDQLTKQIAWFSIGMAFLAWMAVKLPMPALPFLAHYFHTSSQVFKVSVTLNLIGFSVSQIFWGPFSDRYGRRSAIICSFLVAIIGTLLAMLSFNIGLYISGRIIEGFAVGAAAPVGRAIMADALDKLTMARIYAWYAIAALLPPAVGPVIGGYILIYLGWRYIFAFFLLLAVIYLIACVLWFPETKQKKLTKINLLDIVSDIKSIAMTPGFWRYSVVYALINGFMIAYYAAMPFWYVVHFHLSEDSYAWLAFIPIASYIMGSMTTSRLLSKFTINTMLLVGIMIALIVGALVLLLGLFTQPDIVQLNIIIALFSIASGVVTPMANASLMHQFKKKVTILSAMTSGLRVGGAGLLVLISANIDLQSYFPLGIYTILISLVALVSYFAFRSK